MSVIHLKNTPLPALLDKFDKGITKVIVTYSGSGDDGSVDNPTDQDGNRIPGIDWRHEFVKAVYQLLSDYASGWEINDGSRGELVFDRENRRVDWTHTEYYTESRDKQFRLKF